RGGRGLEILDPHGLRVLVPDANDDDDDRAAERFGAFGRHDRVRLRGRGLRNVAACAVRESVAELRARVAGDDHESPGFVPMVIRRAYGRLQNGPDLLFGRPLRPELDEALPAGDRFEDRGKRRGRLGREIVRHWHPSYAVSSGRSSTFANSARRNRSRSEGATVASIPTLVRIPPFETR